MKEVAEFFGFVSVGSTIWNVLGYFALIYLIAGVICEKYRKTAFISAAFWLGAYAFVFVQDILIASFELLFAGTAVMQYEWKISRRAQNVLILVWGAVTFYLLFFSGLNGSFKGGLFTLGIWKGMGSAGFLLLVVGLVILPRYFGFLVMAVGGVLITSYAFVNQVWVFFILNIVFVAANVYALVGGLRKPVVKPPSGTQTYPRKSEQEDRTFPLKIDSKFPVLEVAFLLAVVVTFFSIVGAPAAMILADRSTGNILVPLFFGLRLGGLAIVVLIGSRLKNQYNS